MLLLVLDASKNMASEAIKPPLKILCLHGYRQNGAGFRVKMGSFRKGLKSQAEFVFMDAPHTIPSTNEDQQTIQASEQLGWWFSRENSSFSALEESDVSKGFEESVQAVEKILERDGPFDGLLGFSQGAAFLAMLCLLKQQTEFKGNFDFAIIFAGFKSRSSVHERMYLIPSVIPSLHVYGKTDAVIPTEMSQDLATCFVKPKVCVHDGGHFINMAGPLKTQYKAFLLEMIELKNQQKTGS